MGDKTKKQILFKRFFGLTTALAVFLWSFSPFAVVPAYADHGGGGGSSFKNFDILINEVLFNPTGTDAGAEAIELYNRGPSTIDISNWVIQPGGGSAITIPASTSIPSKGFYQSTAITGLANDKDFVSLFNSSTQSSSTLIDFVEYASDGTSVANTTQQGYAIGDGQWFAGEVVNTASLAEGQSIARANDGSDMNTKRDFSVLTATLGAKNDTTGPTVSDAFAKHNDEVSIRFSEPVEIYGDSDPSTTSDNAIFSISPSLTVNNAWTMWGDTAGGGEINLFTGKHTAGTTYTITMTGIKDMSGNVMTGSATVTFIGFDTASPRVDWVEQMWIPKGVTQTITVHGLNTNFVGGTTAVAIDPATGLTLGSVSVTNATTLSLPITVANDASLGFRKITVTTGSQIAVSTEGVQIGESGGGYGFTFGGSDIWINGAFPTSSTKIEVDFSEPVRLTGIDNASGGGDDASFTLASETNGSALAISSSTLKNSNYTVELTTATQAGVGYELTVNNLVHQDYNGSTNVKKIPANQKFFLMGFGASAGSGTGFVGGFFKPMVISSQPGEGSFGISTTEFNGSAKRIVVEFSEPMDSTTINSTNISVTDGSAAISGTWTYSSTSGTIFTGGPGHGPNAAIFTPSSALQSSKTYYVDVSTKVKSSSGSAVEGNKGPGQGHSFSFSTNMDVSDFGGASTFATYATPPYVTSSLPSSGSSGVPTNSKLQIFFSEAMDQSTIDTTSIDLYKQDSSFGLSEVSITLDTPALDASTKKIATFSPASGSLSSNSKYVIKVFGRVASTLGIKAGMNVSDEIYRSDFETGSTTDTTAPTVIGTYPSDSDVNIPVGLEGIRINFSKPMSATTIKASSITVSAGTTNVSGLVSYDPKGMEAFFSPSNALAPNRTYTLTISKTNAITDINGNALVEVTKAFTTGGADTVKPTVGFVEADTFGLRIEFSESMNSKGANDTANFGKSVLNYRNYTLETGSTTGSLTAVDLKNAMLNWEPHSRSVMIDGLQGNKDTSGQFKLTVSNVTDSSGNAIETTGSANVFYGKVVKDFEQMNCFDCGGQFSGNDGFSADIQNFKAFAPVSVFPMNMMAGLTTNYFVDIPLTKALDVGDKIKLTFPTGVGFSLSGASLDANSPANSDINGPGSGTVTLGSVAVTANTFTATIGGAATQAQDFLHFDVKNVVNATIAKEFNFQFGGDGYTVRVETIDTSDNNNALETLTSMPIFMGKAGANTVNITVKDEALNALQGVIVRLSSPMTGEQTGTTNASGLASFSSIPDGEVWVRTEPVVTVGANDYKGKDYMEPLRVSGGETKTRTITMDKMTSANGFYSVSGSITETFTSDKTLEIWASSWQGFNRKKLCIDASDNTNNIDTNCDGTGDAAVYTLKLQTGQWDIGIQPWIEMDFFGSKRDVPDWLPPEPIHITVAGADLTGKNITIPTISSLNSLTVRVLDASNSDKGVANAHVGVYNPFGGFGFGTGGETDATGGVVLKVMNGTYLVDAFVPGIPPLAPQTVSLTNESKTVTINLKRPERKITGKVMKGNKTLNDVPVFAQEVNSSGNFTSKFQDSFTSSDNASQFTFYVGNNTTWKIGAYIPGIGESPLVDVRVETSDVTKNIVITDSAVSNLGAVTGTISGPSGVIKNAGVWAESATAGGRGGTGTASGEDGTYSLSLQPGSYTLRAHSPSTGEFPAISVTVSSSGSVTEASGTANDGVVNFTASNVATITIDAGASMSAIYAVALDNAGTTSVRSDDRSDTTWGENSQTVELKVPYNAGGTSYEVRVFIPGKGEIETTVNASSSAATLNISSLLPSTITIAGEIAVANASSTKAKDVLVSVCNPSSSFCNETFTSSSDGTYSVEVPKPSSGSTNYVLTVHDNDYVNLQPQTIAVASDASNLTGKNYSIYPHTDTTNVKTITGTVYRDSAISANQASQDAQVWAVSQDGQRVSAEVDKDGSYTLYTETGKNWTLEAGADGYEMTALSKEQLAITDNLTGKNLVLTPKSGYTVSASKQRTVSESGIFSDEESKVKIKIDSGALSGTQGVNKLRIKETTNISEDPSSGKGVVGKGISVEGFTQSNGSVNNLSGGRAIIEMSYGSDITAGNLTTTESNKLKLSYASDLSDHNSSMPSVNFTDEDILFAFSDHFSDFPLESQTGVAPPAKPTGVGATADSASQITISWTAVSGAGGYDIYHSADGTTYTRLGSEPTTTSTSYAHTGLSASSTHYYRVSATDGSSSNPAESAASTAVNATTNASATTTGGGGANITPPPATDEVKEEVKEVVVKETVSPSGQVNITGLSKTEAEKVLIKAIADAKAQVAKLIEELIGVLLKQVEGLLIELQAELLKEKGTAL